MKKTMIKAVEMVRRIRDEHYEQLRGKGPEEQIAFYRAIPGAVSLQGYHLPRPNQVTF